MNHGFQPTEKIDATDYCIAVVRTQWNEHITRLLEDGAVKTLMEAGADTVDQFVVPGAVELTFAAQRLVDTEVYHAVIVLGCVIKGDTPHFDYVCQSVTQGITEINANSTVPVVFGVLTVNNEQQALDRCGGPAGHKGIEAAQTAIAMANFVDQVDAQTL